MVKLSESLSFAFLENSLLDWLLFGFEISFDGGSELTLSVVSEVPVCLLGDSAGRGLRFTWIIFTTGSLMLGGFVGSADCLLSTTLVLSVAVLTGVDEDWDVSFAQFGAIKLLLSLLCLPKYVHITCKNADTEIRIPLQVRRLTTWAYVGSYYHISFFHCNLWFALRWWAAKLRASKRSWDLLEKENKKCLYLCFKSLNLPLKTFKE